MDKSFSYKLIYEKIFDYNHYSEAMIENLKSVLCRRLQTSLQVNFPRDHKIYLKYVKSTSN